MPRLCEFLTAKWIDKTKPLEDKEQKRKDKEIPSLYLRIRKAGEGGSKSWMLIYTDQETRKRKTYVLEGIPGSSKSWELAREKAREALESIHLQNKTPRELALERLEQQKQEEEINKIKRYRIKDLIPLYIPFTRNLRAQESRLSDLTTLSKSVLGGKAVSKLTAADFLRFIDLELEAGNKRRTINKKITELYCMLNKLYKHEVISKEYVHLPPKPEKLNEFDSQFNRRYLQDWERKALIENSAGMKPDWLHAAIVVSLYTGVRPKSLFHLVWRDVHWESRTLFLCAKYMKTKDNWTIPLNEKAYVALESWRRLHSDAPLDSLVFPNRLGNAVARQCWMKYFKRLLEASNMDPNLGWYNMRHDFASQLVMQGVSLYVVKDLMCHKNISTTQVYAHLAPDVKSAAVKLLEQL